MEPRDVRFVLVIRSGDWNWLYVDSKLIDSGDSIVFENFGHWLETQQPFKYKEFTWNSGCVPLAAFEETYELPDKLSGTLWNILWEKWAR